MTKIDSSNYIENAMRTDCVYDDAMKDRLVNCIELIHAAMGMVTEAGELIDMLKKHIYYGKPLDTVNAIEEVGDESWYIAKAINAVNKISNVAWSMNEVLNQNIAKLKLRYPNKFSGEDAINRNVNAERKLLESDIMLKYGVTSKRECVEENEMYFNPCPDQLIKLPNHISERGKDWLRFASKVLAHIEQYTVPQYGDKGNDPVTNWDTKDCLNALTKYAFRHGKNSRDGQDELDLVKIAHFVQIADNKYHGDI